MLKSGKRGFRRLAGFSRFSRSDGLRRRWGETNFFYRIKGRDCRDYCVKVCTGYNSGWPTMAADVKREQDFPLTA